MASRKEQPRFYLSLDRLKANGACEEGQMEWREAFGTEQVPVTRALLERMHKAGYLEWLFYTVFPNSDPAAVQEARDRYVDAPLDSREEASALRDYEQARIDALLNAPLLKDR